MSKIILRVIEHNGIFWIKKKNHRVPLGTVGHADIAEQFKKMLERLGHEVIVEDWTEEKE